MGDDVLECRDPIDRLFIEQNEIDFVVISLKIRLSIGCIRGLLIFIFHCFLGIKGLILIYGASLMILPRESQYIMLMQGLTLEILLYKKR